MHNSSGIIPYPVLNLIDTVSVRYCLGELLIRATARPWQRTPPAPWWWRCGARTTQHAHKYRPGHHPCVLSCTVWLRWPWGTRVVQHSCQAGALKPSAQIAAPLPVKTWCAVAILGASSPAPAKPVLTVALRVWIFKERASSAPLACLWLIDCVAAGADRER